MLYPSELRGHPDKRESYADAGRGPRGGGIGRLHPHPRRRRGVCPPHLPQLPALNAMIGRGCSRIVASPILHDAVR